MDKNAEELLNRLAQLPPEERKRILNAFLESAIVVNRENTDSSCEREESTSGEVDEQSISVVGGELVEQEEPVYALVPVERTQEESAAEDDEQVDEEEEVAEVKKNDDAELTGLLLAGTGVAAGLLGVALENKALKRAGAAGALVGGLLLLKNQIK